jgi:hypothetical protein
MKMQMKANESTQSIFSKPGTSNGVFPMLTMMSPVMCSSQWYGIPSSFFYGILKLVARVILEK